MYVHIKAVTYVTWSDRGTRGNVKHVYIIAVCPYNWIWLWTMFFENCRKKPSLPWEKRITKTHEL